MEKKALDKFLSAVVLIAFAVIWLIYLCVAQIDPTVASYIGIAKNVMLVLTYLVLLYNALGFSKNIIIRLVFVAIAGFLIFCVIAQYIPALNLGKIPTITF